MVFFMFDVVEVDAIRIKELKDQHNGLVDHYLMVVASIQDIGLLMYGYPAQDLKNKRRSPFNS